MESSNNNLADERIILNVGGVKPVVVHVLKGTLCRRQYETYRSTLTAYPNTLLGIMFQKRNNELLRPTNGNEFFFDRDGQIFRYIMQFYRTGEFLWPEQSTRPKYELQLPHPFKHQQEVQLKHTIEISNYELKRELDYFQIPEQYTQRSHDPPPFPFAKAAAFRVDEFIAALKDAIYEMIINFRTKVGITFNSDKTTPVVNPKIDAVANIVIPFAFTGYHILHMFHRQIEEHLKLLYPDLVVRIDKFNGDTPRAHVNVYITLNNNLEPSIILENSCLIKPSSPPDNTTNQRKIQEDKA
ncbi:11439_t:CDS:2 [Ambispora gerdemannii]|uniref:11439_t:CDS:1 n=1 Tax=Ambispora gerdemannii TaxID=144530 RepID=A0A9N8V7A6_9GLOM|nr:11439_t:CDS:2 [Ambispora gerdemannii]